MPNLYADNLGSKDYYLETYQDMYNKYCTDVKLVSRETFYATALGKVVTSTRQGMLSRKDYRARKNALIHLLEELL